jgi:phage terminase Nu1 subunit (DNA packaging protein)
MASSSKDQLGKVARANARNLLKRVQEGKPLTKEQFEFLRCQIEPEKEKPDPEEILNQAVSLDELLLLVSLDSRRVQQLKKEGHITNKGRGKYGLSQVAEYIRYLQGLVQRRKIKTKEGELDPNHERARKDRAMADKLELELELRRGELVDAAEVDSMNAEVDGIIRSSFMSLPSRLANELAALETPREIQIFLDEEIRKTLTQLSDEG